ncbi:MAG: adenylyl-sulfate kinase [Pseudonocardiaceae bacterium]
MVIAVPSPRLAEPKSGRIRSGATIWFTGLPSAGKTTLARTVAARLAEAGRKVELLDGDVVRRELGSGLGFSRQDREQNISRIGYVASLLAGHGVIVLAAVIAPYESARRAVRVRHQHAEVPYLEAYVATPLAVCRARDVKGLYAKQQAGQLQGLTGVDDVYEPPAAPELVLHTQHCTVDQSAEHVLRALAARGLA